MSEGLNFDYALLIPEYILAGTAAGVLLLDAFHRENPHFDRARDGLLRGYGARSLAPLTLISRSASS